MKTVLARFAGRTQTYSYLVPEGDDPQVGDLLLTSISLTKEELLHRLRVIEYAGASEVWAAEARVSTVVEVESYANPKATKFYVQLLPIASIRARQAHNQAVAAEVKRKAAARVKLDQLLAKEDKRERYTRLAATNPEAKALWDELNTPITVVPLLTEDELAAMDVELPRKARAKPKGRPGGPWGDHDDGDGA